jgi:hypothetical protein
MRNDLRSFVAILQTFGDGRSHDGMQHRRTCQIRACGLAMWHLSHTPQRDPYSPLSQKALPCSGSCKFICGPVRRAFARGSSRFMSRAQSGECVIAASIDRGEKLTFEL